MSWECAECHSARTAVVAAEGYQMKRAVAITGLVVHIALLGVIAWSGVGAVIAKHFLAFAMYCLVGLPFGWFLRHYTWPSAQLYWRAARNQVAVRVTYVARQGVGYHVHLCETGLLQDPSEVCVGYGGYPKGFYTKIHRFRFLFPDNCLNPQTPMIWQDAEGSDFRCNAFELCETIQTLDRRGQGKWTIRDWVNGQ